MAQITVKNASNADTAVELPNANGRQAATASRPVALSNEDLAAVNALGTKLDTLAGFVDTLETLIGSSNTLATTLNGYVDQLEGYVDGLETLVTSANTKLDTLHTDLQAGTVATTNAGTSASAGVPMQGMTGGVPVNTKTYTGAFNVTATALTRPANTTAYAANDSISNNATAASVTANSTGNLSDTNDVPIDLAEILLTSTDTGIGGVQVRLHLFNSDPTASSGVVGGDNAAWSNKQAGWVGSFSGTMRAFSDGARGVLVADEGTLRLMNPATGAKNLWWQLQVLGAYTPSANSTTYTPTFKGFQARAA